MYIGKCIFEEDAMAYVHVDKVWHVYVHSRNKHKTLALYEHNNTIAHYTDARCSAIHKDLF
jgi:hypothetical protein